MAYTTEYFGVPPKDFTEVENREEYIASEGQTSFDFLYSISNVDVYLDGLKLSDSSFVATNGTTVVLNTPCTIAQNIQLISRRQVAVTDVVPRTDLTGPTGASFVGFNGINLYDFINLLLPATIASVAGLRTVNKNWFTHIDTTGYYAAGDGGGASYVYDPADTTSTDNAGSIIVGNDGGRWKIVTGASTTERQFGGKIDGTTNDYAAMQTMAANGDWELVPGVRNINSGLIFPLPISMRGKGVKTSVKTTSSFTLGEDLFRVRPINGNENRNWEFKNFQVINTGVKVRNVFFIDLAAEGKFLNKLTIKGIVSDLVTGYFVQLLNEYLDEDDILVSNTDGLFCSVFEDNFSNNGYYLDKVGDSVILQRNTTTGTGVGYYVNQLSTASHVIIRDGNCTSAGGALLVKAAFNLTFDNMQVECPVTYTGAQTALVTINTDDSVLINNVRITNNNINCQVSNPTLFCIFLDYADSSIIDGNTLFCHPTTGQHIVIDSHSRNTYVGLNKYFSTITGAEITPRITDNGVGTMGIWKDASLPVLPAVGWTDLIDGISGTAVGFFKTKEGLVMLRGNLTGDPSTAAQTLFTLPLGFRPRNKAYVFYTTGQKPSNAGLETTGVQVLPTGEVQIINTGSIVVYLDGIVFSTR